MGSREAPVVHKRPLRPGRSSVGAWRPGTSISCRLARHLQYHRRGMRTALFAFVFLGSLGCAVERDVDWTYQIPDGLERAGSHLVARIREGGCREADLILYEADPRSGGGPPLPVLVQGTMYCFELRLEDEDCLRYAAATTLVEVDETTPVVNQMLAALPTPVECLAFCPTTGGCPQCGEALVFCPASGATPARCCPDVFSDACQTSRALTCDTLD